MKKYGGFIPGIRAGRPTERYLAHVLSRLTAPGSLYLALIALIPALAFICLGTQQQVPLRRYLDPDHRRSRVWTR